MKFLKKILLTLLLTGILSFSILVLLAMSPVKNSRIGSTAYHAKLFSRSLLMSTYSQVRNWGNNHYAPNPLDEDYRWEDLDQEYFKKIRTDRRLQHFYDQDTIGFTDVLKMKDFLRNRFPHGRPSRNYEQENLLEMLDAAEKGERFLCGGASKMLIQMVMAAGKQARRVRLASDYGHGHTVMEFWSEEYQKWCLLDPDFNVHYTDRQGAPLSALDLYHKASRQEPVLKHRGSSRNTRIDKNDYLFKEYYSQGIGIDYYNKWISRNHPRSHPERSPVNSVIYLGENRIRQRYFAFDYPLTDTAIVELIRQKPE